MRDIQKEFISIAVDVVKEKNYTEYQNRIFSKLTGEGGLRTDFNPDGSDKTINMESLQVLGRMLEDDTFCNELTGKIVDKYFELCQLRGLNPERPNMFDRVMTVADCDIWARYFGKQMLMSELNENAKRGR